MASMEGVMVGSPTQAEPGAVGGAAHEVDGGGRLRRGRVGLPVELPRYSVVRSSSREARQHGVAGPRPSEGTRQ